MRPITTPKNTTPNHDGRRPVVNRHPGRQLLWPSGLVVAVGLLAASMCAAQPVAWAKHHEGGKHHDGSEKHRAGIIPSVEQVEEALASFAKHHPASVPAAPTATTTPDVPVRA